MQTISSKSLGNFTGAFADAAVLLPLLVALALTTGYSGASLLLSAGVAYVAAGVWFRIPMSVQPLKSVVVTALAVGASMAEIRLSGLIIGVLCLALSYMPSNRWAAKVPRSLIHGLQFGLGILLIIKGLTWPLPTQTLPSLTTLVIIALAAIILVGLGTYFKKPIMGWVASLAMLAAIITAFTTQSIANDTAALQPIITMRLDILLMLILPQIALTLTNSVVATSDVASRYYGEKATRATPKALLKSIGGGNIISAAIAGLPFCHGSGGITAHHAGGAKTWHMNLIIGITLILLAMAHAFISPVIPAFHPWVIGVLLAATGVFHMKLAMPSLQHKLWRYQIILMALATLWSQNLLIVLAVGIVLHYIFTVILRQKSQEV